MDGDDLTPPPYWIMTRLPPSAPPGPEAALMPSPGPGEVLQQRCSSARSPGVRRAALSAGSNPAMETSGQCPQNSTSTGPPRLYPPLLVSTDGNAEENIAIRQRLRSAKEQVERIPLQMPLESHDSFRFRMNGTLPSALCSLVSQPFSSTDKLNWQRHAAPYLGQPRATIRLMETIFRTHRPA